ncbi:unnamed protein product [Prunus armeniaca]|uniref:Uncharacterized protein n=1 Tax=Prunus armeniaca TaxID=36596 RepID=A0A6J5W315_PRUAR|nr:unnamed protein product [Prunus armeniaca]
MLCENAELLGGGMVDGGCGGFDCGGGYGVGVGVGLTEEGKKRKEEAVECSIFGYGFEKVHIAILSIIS